VSTFDDGKVSANYGSWETASDAMNGGKSTASMKIIQPGAENSKGALQVNGEIVPGAQITWAGAGFNPGNAPLEPVNLSNKKEISFWAKGDGKTYVLVMLTAARSGQDGMPAMTQFFAGPEWKHYNFPLSTFETDGSDIASLLFGAAQQPGKFEFAIDQVEIK
jgi:hypothetical protein